MIFSNELDASVCAQIEWDDLVVITISTGFIAEIQGELLNYGHALVKLASEPDRHSPAAERVLEAVEELIVSFIILHEMLHLVGGHVDWMSSRTQLLSFDERKLGLFSAEGRGSSAAKRPSYRKIADMYLLESEADCTAVQWIVQSTFPSGLKRLLGKAPRTCAADISVDLTSSESPRRSNSESSRICPRGCPSYNIAPTTMQPVIRNSLVRRQPLHSLPTTVSYSP